MPLGPNFGIMTVLSQKDVAGLKYNSLSARVSRYFFQGRFYPESLVSHFVRAGHVPCSDWLTKSRLFPKILNFKIFNAAGAVAGGETLRWIFIIVEVLIRDARAPIFASLARLKVGFQLFSACNKLQEWKSCKKQRKSVLTARYAEICSYGGTALEF